MQSRKGANQLSGETRCEMANYRGRDTSIIADINGRLGSRQPTLILYYNLFPPFSSP